MKKLKSDIDFVDFLKQAERYRKEVNQSDHKEKKSMLNQLNDIINSVYDILNQE